MASTSTASCSKGTGYVWAEQMFWHNPGAVQSLEQFMEPSKHWENAETKRRIHSLLSATGVLDQLKQIKPRLASEEELARVHDRAYIEAVRALSQKEGLHTCGDVATFSAGGYKLAQLAAGGALAALEAIMRGDVTNAYVLARPPGHHAERAEGAGFCIFNNIAVAAAAALAEHGLQRVAVVDYDVHHGNGTQHIFEHDPRVLFISIHQDSNYPLHSGAASEVGVGAGQGYTINIPLPPGSGSGAYKAAFERCVVPALDAFKPQLLCVSSGFDGSFMDPLAAMILSSDDFRWMAARLRAAADRHCGGKLLATHEGGYSEVYVPFCALAVIEAMSDIESSVQDPFLHEVRNWGYQSLQAHQDAAISAAEVAVELLRSKVGAPTGAGQ